jgi:hypothetical protein
MPTTTKSPAPEPSSPRGEDKSAAAKDKQDDAPAKDQSSADAEEPTYERALFRSEQHPDLTQYLPSGAVAHFQGQYFSTGDTALIAELRALLDGGHPLFTEEDPAPIYPCPFCTQPAVSFSKKADLTAHMRQAHPGLKVPKATAA